MPEKTSLSRHPSDFPNIIFDLGGVILNIDYGLTISAFQHLGALQFDTQYTQAVQTKLFDDFERGQIQASAFRDGLRLQLGLTPTDDEMDKAWNAMLLDLPAERLELLSRLKTARRTFLLSNTNQIHVRCFERAVYDAYGMQGLKPLFEAAYYSCDIGMRKPETEIFKFVLERHGLLHHETLFIDDSAQHIEGARRAGIQAYHLTGGETIHDLFGHIS
jgi:glucose-1-phosphatase